MDGVTPSSYGKHVRLSMRSCRFFRISWNPGSFGAGSALPTLCLVV